MPEQPKQGPTQKRTLLLMSLALATVLFGKWMTSGSVPTSDAPPAAPAPELVRAQGSAGPLSPVGQSAKAPSRPEDTRSSGQAIPETHLDDPAQGTPDQAAREISEDPQAAPRAILAVELHPDSAGAQALERDGLSLTTHGLSLDHPPTRHNPRRFGEAVSPPISLDFPTNAITPLWQATTPEGTAVEIALAMSNDGQRWTPWYPSPVDADGAGQITRTFPDGRPNPNFGYIPGTMLVFGLEEWTWVRFRVMLSSSVEEAPEVHGIRFFYQNTTLGKGQAGVVPGGL